MSNEEGKQAIDSLHTVYEIAKDTYRIDEDGVANCYLLIGETKAILIDSGIGLGDLGSVVASLTNKPVSLYLTHNHCDHSGGRYYFKEYYLGEDDKKPVYSLLSGSSACRKLLKMHTEFKEIPVLCPHQHPHPLAISLPHEFTGDLGGRVFKIITVPGHTAGHLAIIDEKEKLMFTGDNLCPSLWLQLPGCLPLSKWLDSAKTLQKLAEKYTVYSGHGVGLTSKNGIDNLIALGERALSDIKVGKFKKAKKTTILSYPDIPGVQIVISKKNLK
jgi:hydroxyacylglutathione hydrolase